MNEIEETLRNEREIEPAPFFARRVMAAIRAERQFAPLPFPWRRMVVAIALLLLAIVAGVDAPEVMMTRRQTVAIVVAALSIALAAMALSGRHTRNATDRE